MQYPVLATWTKDDTIADWLVTVKDPVTGLVRDLTGYAAKLYAVGWKNRNPIAAINGTISAPTSGQILFDCTTIAAGPGGESAFQCQIELITGGKEQRSPDFMHAVKPKL